MNNAMVYSGTQSGMYAPTENTVESMPLAELYELLRQQVLLYTGGESSSVPVELAEELMQSILFCLAFGNKRNIPSALPPRERLQACQQALYRETEKVKALYRMARCGTPLAGNAFYRQTLRELGTALEYYDIRFFAHLPPSGIDYQLLTPVSEALQGICYTNSYLRHWLIEMRLVSCFSPAAVRGLFHIWLPEWRELCVNLCEPVFINALGRTLLGEEPQPLSLSAAQREALQNLLGTRCAETTRTLLRNGTAQMCNRLEIWDEAARTYFTSCAEKLVPRLQNTKGKGWVKLFQTT